MNIIIIIIIMVISAHFEQALMHYISFFYHHVIKTLKNTREPIVYSSHFMYTREMKAIHMGLM